MKKFLLLTALLVSVLPVSAVSWTLVETDIPDLHLYVDSDSLMYINNDECYYAIKYSSGDNPEKVAYLKSNSSTNYIGVIQTADYDVETYNPNVVFKNVHVFMKPIKQGSFLSYVHNYSTSKLVQESLAQAKTPVLREDNVKQVSYTLTNNIKDYVAQTGSALNSNWKPPKSGHNTQAIIILTIGTDGSLQNYRFAKSSGDEATDRSIVSAVEKTVPFMKFPRSANDNSSANFQFVFDYKLFNKSVI